MSITAVKAARLIRNRSETYVDHVEKIQKLYEGSTEAAKEMEYVLVHAAGGKQESEYKNLKKYTDKLGFAEPLEVGKKIIDGIGLTDAGGYMAESG